MIDVDLFAGPGGLDEARRLAGHDTVPLLGLEWERWACRTAMAAGHTRVRADVATFPTAHLRGRVRLLLGAPPCPEFSAAGQGGGRLALDLFVGAVAQMLAGQDVRAEARARHRALLLAERGEVAILMEPAELAELERKTRDAALVLEPARWIHDTEPEAVVLEQVPAVLPIWQALARELRDRGWSAWAGVLNAADYGVPQTRQRALLIASRVRTVAPPEPTHAQHPAVDLFGAERLPWVSMAAALGWGPTVVNTRGERTTPGGNEFNADRPSWALTKSSRSWVRTGQMTRMGGGVYVEYTRHVGRPAPAVTTHVASWRVGQDGDALGPERLIGTDLLETAEAATLQGFPSDYPWQGSRMRVFEQIGNAVPPPLGAHCITAALGPAEAREAIAS